MTAQRWHIPSGHIYSWNCLMYLQVMKNRRYWGCSRQWTIIVSCDHWTLLWPEDGQGETMYAWWHDMGLTLNTSHALSGLLLLWLTQVVMPRWPGTAHVRRGKATLSMELNMRSWRRTTHQPALTSGLQGKYFYWVSHWHLGACMSLLLSQS